MGHHSEATVFRLRYKTIAISEQDCFRLGNVMVTSAGPLMLSLLALEAGASVRERQGPVVRFLPEAAQAGPPGDNLL